MTEGEIVGLYQIAETDMNRAKGAGQTAGLSKDAMGRLAADLESVRIEFLADGRIVARPRVPWAPYEREGHWSIRDGELFILSAKGIQGVVVITGGDGGLDVVEPVVYQHGPGKLTKYKLVRVP